MFFQVCCESMLGVNTIWYLHIHFVCAKLFAFLAIEITFPLVVIWLEQLYYNGKVIFLYNKHRAPA